MNIQKWIIQNKFGIVIGMIIAAIISVNLGLMVKILLGGLIGGYLQSLSGQSNTGKKNYGFIQFLANPWVIGGLLTLGAIVLQFFQKQPPTLAEQIEDIPIWIYFVIGFFLLLIIKALKKKPRTIIIQEQR